MQCTANHETAYLSASKCNHVAHLTVGGPQAPLLDLTPSLKAPTAAADGGGGSRRVDAMRRDSISGSDSESEGDDAGGAGRVGGGGVKSGGDGLPSWYGLFPPLDEGTQVRPLALFFPMYVTPLPLLVLFP